MPPTGPIIAPSSKTAGLLSSCKCPPGKSSASEEITNFKGRQDELPFINIAGYLKSCGILVPEVLTYSAQTKIMVLEDLGDDLLATIIEKTPPADHVKIYEKSLDLLARLQKATSSNQDESCLAFRRSFDATLLNWEFDHFREYGIERLTGVRLNPKDLFTFESLTRAISAEIESFEYVFTHRDFQSRNIIMHRDNLYLIDFQDALMGPRAYDLVALLRDSYIKIEEPKLEHLVEHFAGKMGFEIKAFRREFHLVTVQRKLKDAGRFVYIDKIKGNPNYLKFIPTSLGYVLDALKKLPEYSELSKLIEKYVAKYAENPETA
jgi:hypothetical protein